MWRTINEKLLLSFKLTIFVLILLEATITKAHWIQHHRHQQLLRTSKWSKRQAFSVGGPPAQQQEIELNVTVPYIFSARLYPYGPDKGDSTLDPAAYSQTYVLKTELTYFEERNNVLYITRDGAIGFSPDLRNVSRLKFPRGPKVIAPYWTPVNPTSGKVYYRETNDENILSLASSEIQIQYRFGTTFRPKSVFIVTWENVSPSSPAPSANPPLNTFQIALILSSNGSFAHVVYSKLNWHDNAVAGFNEGNGNGYYNLPGSATANVRRLANDSDIGIPGEWLFKLDGANVYLCGPGYKGLECIRRCDKGEWYYDCIRICHCADNAICHSENGYCPGPVPKCSNGWSHPPTCDIDVDECTEFGSSVLCHSNAPDCINTPGSFICNCLSGFENEKCLSDPAQVLPDTRDFSTDRRVSVANGQSQFPALQEEQSHTNSATDVVALVPQRPAVDTLQPVVGLINNQSRNVDRFISPDGAVPNFLSAGSTVLGTTTDHQNPNDPNFQGVGAWESAEPAIIDPRSPTQIGLDLLQTLPTAAPDGQQRSGTIVLGRDHGSLFPTQPVNSVDALGTTLAFLLPQNSTDIPTPSRVQLLPREPNSSLSGLFNSTTEGDPGCALNCGANAHCKLNLDNRPSCVCNIGWSGDGIFCVDVNECFIENSCQGNSRCVNTPGSYHCACEEGFEYSPTSRECLDIDECELDTAQCPGNGSSQCVNTFGSYECRCKPGYNGNPSGILGCIDINECLIATFYCGDNADCENTIGGYRCACRAGFQPNNERTACEDVNECLIGAVCPDERNCLNSVGSYTCVGGERGGNLAETTIISTVSATDNPTNQVADNVIDDLNAKLIQSSTVLNSSSAAIASSTTILPTVVVSQSLSAAPYHRGLYFFDRLANISIPKGSTVQKLVIPTNVILFGKGYNTLFVSANGLISFDAPLHEYMAAPLSQLRLIGLAPLYRDYNSTKGTTNVYMKPYGARENAILLKATMNVREGFHDPTFTAASVVVITYETFPNVIDNDENLGNTDEESSAYQVVIISGNVRTYVMFIYDSLSGVVDGQAGIVGLDDRSTFYLPGSAGDLSQLVNASNIQARGKWMYRVDVPSTIYKCAAGRNDPPFCSVECSPGTFGFGCNQTCQCADRATCNVIDGACSNGCVAGFEGRNCQHDMDECATDDTHRCHANAQCLNYYGGYGCRCQPGYTGNGVQCDELNAAAVARPTPSSVFESVATNDTATTLSGTSSARNIGVGVCQEVSCGRNAHCVVRPNGVGACTCNNGFAGDGHTCSSSAPSSASSSADQTSSPTQQEKLDRTGAETRFNPSAVDGTDQRPQKPVLKNQFWQQQNSVNLPVLESGESIRQSPFANPVIRPTNVQAPTAAFPPDPRFQVSSNNWRFSSEVPRDRSADVGTSNQNSLAGNRPASVQDRNSPRSTTPDNNTSHILVIIIPAILCGVWLILIVVLLIICLRRRKQRQRERFGLGYYVPQSQSSPSTTETGTAGTPSTATAAAAATGGPIGGAAQNGFYTTWTIPRPQPTYDYYQGAYYMDPFFNAKQARV